MNTVKEASALSSTESGSVVNKETMRRIFTDEEFTFHINRCVLNKRDSQEIIYKHFFAYALSICLRITYNRDDSLEIVNDGFLKIFKAMDKFRGSNTDVEAAFKPWLRQIMVNAGIDFLRRKHTYKFNVPIQDQAFGIASKEEDAIAKITCKEILKCVQQLSPAYKRIFKLFVLHRLTHEEISNKLGISVGASKSNLSKAREQLQKILARNQRVASV